MKTKSQLSAIVRPAIAIAAHSPPFRRMMALCVTLVAALFTGSAHAAPPGTGWTQTFSKDFTTLPPICQTAGSATPGWLPCDYWNNHIWINTNSYNCWPGIDTGYNPFSIAMGSEGVNVLKITANRTPGGMSAGGLPYVSGMLTTSVGANYPQDIRSSTPFSQTYGYFEIRAKLPTAAGTSKGMWPAFWLLPANGSGGAEYDIFEVLGDDPTTIYQSSHWNDWASHSTLICTGPDTSNGFHTYGFQWDASNIRWYIDGILTNVATNRYNAAMYPLINLSVGGDWPGEPNASTVFPAAMHVKYLKIYSGGTVNTDIIKDNTDTVGITFNGTWIASTVTPGYYGSNYWHDGNTNKTAGQAIRWTPCLPYTGSYQVFARWTSGTSRCTNVPYQITHASGTTTVPVNQQLNNGTWVSLGTYNFNAGTAGYVRVSTTGTTGHVIADAVRFLKQS